MGSWPWQTYTDYPIHFEGRIALSPSIRFGLGGALFLYIIQPIFEKIVQKMGEKKVKVFAIVFLILVIIDMIYSFVLK